MLSLELRLSLDIQLGTRCNDIPVIHDTASFQGPAEPAQPHEVFCSQHHRVYTQLASSNFPGSCAGFLPLWMRLAASHTIDTH